MTKTKLKSQISNDDVLLAHYLVRRRIQSGYRAKDVAKRANLSPRTISEVEHGIHMPTKEILDAILQALDCSYNQDQVFFDQCQKLAQQLFVEAVTLQHDEMNLTLHTLAINAKRIQESKAYPYYYQAKVGKLIHGSILQTDIEEIENGLEEMAFLSDSMEPAYRLRYYELLLFYNSKKRTLPTVKDQLETMERYMHEFQPTNDSDLYALAFLHFRLVEVCRKLEKYAKALEHYYSARDLFQSLCCFVRFPSLELMKANVLMASNGLLEASKIYQRLIENHSNSNPSSVIFYALNNLSWYYMVDGEYDLSVTYTKRYIEECGLDDNISFHLPYCYWQTRNFELALQAIQESYLYATEPSSIRLLNMVQILCSPITKKTRSSFQKFMNQAIEECEQFGNINDKFLMYRFASDAYEFLEDYPQQCYYLEKFLEVKQSTVIDLRSN